jgi:chromosome segregation ATPase
VDQVGAVQDRIRAAQKTQLDLQELQRSSEESNRRVADRLSSLEQEFSESDEQLKALLAGFDDQVSGRRQELNRLRQQEASLQSSVKSIRDKEGVLKTRLGEGFEVENQFAKNAEKESESMKDIARQLNMAPPPPPPASSSVAERMGRVESFLQELDRLRSTCEQDGLRTVGGVQKLVDAASSDARAAITRLQQLLLEVDHDEKELYKLNREKTQCRTELASCDNSASQRAARPEAEADLQQARTQWQEFEASYRPKSEQLARDRRAVESDIRDLSDRIATDSRLHQDMSLHRAESERLDAQRRQAEADLVACKATARVSSDKYRSIITRHVASTGSAINAAALCAFSSYQDVEAVSRFLSAEATPQLSHSINRISGELQGVQRDLAQLQAKRDMDLQRRVKMEASLEQLRQAERQVQDNLERLGELRRECDLEEAQMSVDDYEAVKSAIKQAEECAAEEEMALRSSKAWRDVVMKKSRDNGQRKCPCCTKPLTGDETSVFERSVEKLFKGHKATEEIIASVKSRVERARNIFRDVSDCFVKITGFGPQRKELQELDSRVSDAGSRSAQLLEKEQQLKAELESANKDKGELTVCVLELERLQSDWMAHTLRLGDVENKLRALTRGLSSDQNDRRSLAEIEEAQRQREVEREDLQRRKDRLADEDSRLTKQLHALRSGLAEREKALLEVEQRVARVTALEEKVRSIEATERSVTAGKEGKAVELAQMKRTVADKEAVEKATREELRKAEEKSRQALTRIATFRTDLVRTRDDCTRYFIL